MSERFQEESALEFKKLLFRSYKCQEDVTDALKQCLNDITDINATEKLQRVTKHQAVAMLQIQILVGKIQY